MADTAVVDPVADVCDKFDKSGKGGAWHVISASKSIPPAWVLVVDEMAQGA